ncbi:DUF4149 domain-containing protein [uncultured Ferrovibrio sp.]|jgi:uncharacterized membrane protein|uniref:DUF4149 domain-containing protein n=1 Tax=uncultured Ferrovibrio sp. TaxID=1576913 RepID=UPI0026081B53|nr:DUF4149 domain-containing protein [uncultured Ferrovibrio sp.]
MSGIELLLFLVAIFAAALLLGGMMFFSFIVAPTVFRVLEPVPGLKFLRALFSLYHIINAILAAIAGLALAAIHDVMLAGTMGFVAVLAAFVHQGLMPRINNLHDAARWGDDSARPKFRRLHRLSVMINFVQIFAVFVVLLRLVY